jgi:hypothetical protein
MRPLTLPRLALFLPLVLFPAVTAGKDDKSPPTETAAVLVRQLGDPSFRVRDRADQQLRQLGRATVAALEAGLNDPDPEVRRRCQRLLPLARRTDLDLRLDAFVTGKEGPKTPSLPAWSAFRGVVGSDQSARDLFAAIYRAEPALLEALEKDPRAAATQVKARCQQLVNNLYTTNGKQAAPPSAGEVMALLFVAGAAQATPDVTTFYTFTNLLYNQNVRSSLQNSPAMQKVLVALLERRPSDQNLLSQTVYLAVNLGLTEYAEFTLKPAVRKFAEAAAVQTNEPYKLTQALSLARNLDLKDVIEQTITPAARKLAATATQPPYDLNRLSQAAFLANDLRLQDVIDKALKPAVRKVADDIAKQPAELNRIYQVLNVARTVGAQDAVESALKPAVQALAQQAVKEPVDYFKFSQALNLARTLNLQDCIDNTLKPSFHKLALAAERSADVGKLNQLVVLAQSLNLPEAVEKTLKPLARKALLASKDQPVSAALSNQALTLTRTLRLKEGIEPALRMAQSGSVNVWTRGQAILVVAELGDKDQFARLEPLLGDTTTLGTTTVNGTRFRTQLGDVALGAMVHLSGQRLADYGFPYFQAIPNLAPFSTSANCFGFTEDSDRAAALKKWREWTAKQKK